MSTSLTTEWLRRWNETKAKFPVAPAKPAPSGGTPTSTPPPDKVKQDDSQSPDSNDKGTQPDIDDMDWYMGGLDYERDAKTGLAKWPLSFKKMSKDTKMPNGKGSKPGARPHDQKPEQPPIAV